MAKQERRGGIETERWDENHQRVDRKQERRGGIETRAGIDGGERDIQEAGTPWWH